MTIPARGTKTAGGTSFTTGAILAAEVNADLDTLYTILDGGLTADNISGSAAIPNASLVVIEPDHVNDHAATAAEFLDDGTSPGDHFTPVLPTDLEGELDAIRYRIKYNQLSTNLKSLNASNSMEAVGWIEPPCIGRNLLPNPGFETQTGGAGTAPDGWTLTGTPSTCEIQAADDTSTGLYKRSLRLVGSGTGINTTVSGLKADTKYRVGVAWKRVANNLVFATSGGLGASVDYGDIAILTNSGTSLEYQNGVMMTDGSATDIVVSIVTSGGAAAEMDLFYAWMYEMADDAPVEAPHIPMQTAVYSSADDAQTNAGAGAWATKSDLSISQYIPAANYRLFYEVTVCFRSSAVGSATDPAPFGFRIQQNIDAGGATTVEGPIAYMPTIGGDINCRAGGSVTMKYIVENPTPGSTYAFTFDAYVDGTTGTLDSLIFNPTINGVLATQSSAKLWTERI